MQLQKYRCDGLITQDSQFSVQWFAVPPLGKPKFLAENLVLLDAGDYDNDGKSEVIFMIDRYNRGGYEIYWDDFNKHAIFEFNHH